MPFFPYIDCHGICPACSGGFSTIDTFLCYKKCTGRQFSNLKAAVRRRVNYKFQRAMGESPVIEERQYSPEPELPSKKPTQAHHLSPQVYAEPSRDSLINLSRSLTITSNAVHPADGGLIDDFQGDLFNTLEHDNLLI
ncbi:hypothetical protein FPSE_02203 [Fusarium pseudograminearum CS3096]|uniref:Uncharacterized protein n=1 Tax=Fusarium pseudograminearum (strain CS3096) TaxID=1028729 RepID=K3W2I4_FUSPC|nr:hypothetical protein FPSE_02203 [Fusarium pseudograminearum CS3096]EKJ77705.1 hypothetical protein FPSE_02203 [Fusarium pseudograminearum CS3096]